MLTTNPKISIVIPISDMKNGDYFLWRNINSIMAQTFKDHEIIITKEGRMAENTNAGIRQARGEIIKILYMDDYLAHGWALEGIAYHFRPNVNWMATGCMHDHGDGLLVRPHIPKWTDDIRKGANTIGSPSVIAFRNGLNIYFDERMDWVLDCDFYARVYDKYGEPEILELPQVVIGLGDHQMTHTLTEEEKLSEYKLLPQ